MRFDIEFLLLYYKEKTIEYSRRIRSCKATWRSDESV